MVEVKRQVFKTYSPIFEELGYEAVPSLWQFRKSFKGGYTAFILSVNVEDEQTSIELKLAVRHHSVENYIESLTNGLISSIGDSMTLSASMGALQGEPHRTYVIRRDPEIKEVYDQMQLFVNHIGISLLEDWKHLKKLDALFNRNIYDDTLVPNAFQKAVRGLTIARFTGNEKYSTLVEKHTYYLHYKEFPLTHRKILAKLTKFLDLYNPN